MRFWEAMKMLEEGKKIRAADWESSFWASKLRTTHPDGFLFRDLSDMEWELHEEHPKAYTFMEVIQGLKEGKRFKRMHASWPEEDFVIKGNSSLGFVLGPLGCPTAFTIADFEATDWVEVK